jgi:hypothetical protein
LKGHDYAKSPNYVGRASKIWELCSEAQQQYVSWKKRERLNNFEDGKKKKTLLPSFNCNLLNKFVKDKK